MSKRSERIAKFRSKMGTTRFGGGSVGGLTADGQSTRSFTVGGSDAVKMTIGADGRVVSVLSATVSSPKSGGETAGGGTGGVVSVSGSMITGLKYDTSSHSLIAYFGSLKVSDGVATIVNSGSAVVFTATPHSGEI